MQVSIDTLYSTLDLSNIPDFILNLYVFMPFLYNLFPYDGQNYTRSSKRNGKNNKFGYNVLIICRYLNLVKNHRMIL
jgi:hypothetical protein